MGEVGAALRPMKKKAVGSHIAFLQSHAIVQGQKIGQRGDDWFRTSESPKLAIYKREGGGAFQFDKVTPERKKDFLGGRRIVIGGLTCGLLFVLLDPYSV